MLVWMNSAGPSMERSTWLSAAKWITRRGLCAANAARIASASQMSAWMFTSRASPACMPNASGLAA